MKLGTEMGAPPSMTSLGHTAESRWRQTTPNSRTDGHEKQKQHASPEIRIRKDAFHSESGQFLILPGADAKFEALSRFSPLSVGGDPQIGFPDPASDI
jgi:hypothetical protein